MRETTYRFGDVEVDASGREVRRAGTRVSLEPKALDVLLLLLAEAGRVVDKRRLLRDVWADVHVTDSSLARAVTQVRRALGDDIRAPRYVETVPTRGYRFVGDLIPPYEPAPSAAAANGTGRGLPASEEPVAGSGSGARPPRTPRHAIRPGPWARVAVGVLVAVTAAVAATVGRREGPASAVEQGLSAMVVQAATHRASQVTTSQGLDADPAPSPDGSLVAYASDASGSLEIVVRSRVSPGTARAITGNDGDNVDPAWSPDGQWLAYHSRRFGGVWVVPASGGPPRQVVVEGASPSWSPDGQAIVFQTAGEPDVLGGVGGAPSTLATVRVETGVVTPLTQPGDPPGFHGNPVWLPGHETIVFVSVRLPAADVWQVTPGQPPTRLGGCHATCRPFAFRREGTAWVGAVVGAKGGDLWLAPVTSDGRVDMSRGQRAPLPRTLPVADVAVSYDGSTLAYANAERTSEAWTMDVPDGQVRDGLATRVLLAERRPRYGEFAFSPDGSRLAYMTARIGDGWEVWIHDLRTGESRQTPPTVAGFVKGWLPDGARLVVVEPDAPLRIQAMDITTGRGVPLGRGEDWQHVEDVARRLFTLRVAPDGRRFIYTSDVDGALGVRLGDLAAGTPAVPLARGVGFGAWSSDGTRIAVQQMRGWRTGVAIVRPGESSVRSLVTDADQAWPTDWSPDDKYIVYAALRDGRWALEAVEVATGRVVRLTPPGAPSAYVRWPVWSPRGDRIVYERGYWTGNVWVAELPET